MIHLETRLTSQRMLAGKAAPPSAKGADANMNRNHRIEHWDPEDAQAWEASNHAVARRNLLWITA
ncbi:Nitrate/nitrite transporter [Mycobacterium sp. 012931]|nr:Nitrate/nitrite transporter [Mycobacterium sp. 012931]